MDSKTLYIRDNSGAMIQWRVAETETGIMMEYGQVGGSMQIKYEDIDEGKGGRSLDEQIQSRMESRINSKRDKGYVESYEKAATNKATNILGYCKPMLAIPYEKVPRTYFNDCYIQRKYDGNRCLIHNNGTRTIAYTRNGKLFTTLGHILKDVDIPVGMTLDGELYCHGVPLQRIVSWGKRLQQDTAKLKFIAYDIISPEPYSTRLAVLRELKKDKLGDSIELAETLRYGPNSPVELDVIGVNKLLKEFIDDGYEGAIIRHGSKGYEDGKRSRNLIKVKAWQSCECEVIGVEQSVDGWAILICLYKGKTFRVSAPGDMSEKHRAWDNRHAIIESDIPVTVEYANLTKDGIPFHPVAVAWRDYE